MTMSDRVRDRLNVNRHLVITATWPRSLHEALHVTNIVSGTDHLQGKLAMLCNAELQD